MGCLSTQQKQMTPEDYGRFQRESLNLVKQSIPELAQLDEDTWEQMTSTALKRQGMMSQGLIDQAGSQVDQVSDINTRSTDLQSEGDLRRVSDLGGRFLDAIKETNPELYARTAEQETPTGLRNLITQRGENDMMTIPAIDQMFGSDNFRLRRLRDTAEADVARGGRLSDEMLRNVTQDSRSADESRGIFRSGMSVGNEILNTERARKENLAFADQRLAGIMGLLGQSEGRNMAIRNHFMNSGNAAQAGAFGEGQQSIANRQFLRFDPTQAVMNRPSVNQFSSQANSGLSAGLGQNATRPNFMNDFNAMNSFMVGNEVNRRTSNANNAAGLMGGLMGAAGNITSALINK